jgi:hypothetical protein
MNLTYGEIHCARRGANMVLGGKRNLPMIAKFKLARIHDALDKVFGPLEEYRIGLVQKYGEERFADEEKKVSLGWQIAEGSENYKLFEKDWDEFCKQTMDVTVTPITLTMLGESNDGLETLEFKLLGPLVVEQ